MKFGEYAGHMLPVAAVELGNMDMPGTSKSLMGKGSLAWKCGVEPWVKATVTSELTVGGGGGDTTGRSSGL
jgi:hypothetical protein